MSLKDIRSECSEFAALLQPHVDGELDDEEQRRVSEHLEVCDACRSAVSEQMWVRATLRSLDREAAPTQLRRGILAALDEEDAAQEETSSEVIDAPVSPVSIEARPRGSRRRDLFRGSLVMVPAAAVAAGLFFVARGGLEPVQTLPSAGLSAAMTPARGPADDGSADTPALSELDAIRPQLDFPLQVAPSRDEDRVELVGARLDPADQAGLGARLRYRVGGDQHVIDRQRPIGGPQPSGATVVFRGQPYTVNHESGAPTLHFELGGVAHQLTLEGARPSRAAIEVDSPDFAVLLDMAHQLGRDGGVQRAARR